MDAGGFLLSGKGGSQSIRPRGLGDHVNASNTAKKKLGDCEFQDGSRKVVTAYESHGGTLTDAYLNEHLQSLERTLEQRIEEEWTSASGWKVDLVFVVHNNNLKPKKSSKQPPTTFKLKQAGVPITVKVWTFAKFFGELPTSGVTGAFRTYLHAPLNEPSTPEQFRAKYRKIVAPG